MQQNNRPENWETAFATLEQALPEDATVSLVWESATPTVEIRISGLPRLRLELERAVAPWNAARSTQPLLVVRTRNDIERQRLRQEGRNFIDLAGAVHINAAGFYIDRSDLAAAPTGGRVKGRRDPYTDVASHVVRTLLMTSTSRVWSIRNLARAAGVDPSTASRTISELRRRDLVRDERPGERRRSRIRVPDPRAVVEDWVGSYRWIDNHQFRLAAPVGDPNRFAARLPDFLGDERWALALQAGAMTLAPHAVFDVVHAYVDVDSDTAVEEIAFTKGWEESDSGKLVLLRPYYTESVWFQNREINGLPVVSALQLVLDLWHYPVRGGEQARHLMETILRPIWESDAGSG